MKRKKFLQTTFAGAFLMDSMSVSNVWSAVSTPSVIPQVHKFPDISGVVNDKFAELIQWLQQNGWAKVMNDHLGISIDFTRQPGAAELTATLANIREISKQHGFSDFAGNKLIEPGDPSLSLLYHALASARVKYDQLKEYPTIAQLDSLENYIYTLKPFDWSQITGECAGEKRKLFRFAVLAYEYRPGYKTPTAYIDDSKKHAQLVFSRTGIARIGDRKTNYDARLRSFTNKPIKQEDEKHIAATPARYGLFLVEMVTFKDSELKVMNYLDTERSNERHFIKPIRKLFNDDIFTVEFSEYHVNEKLGKLAKFNIDCEPIEFSENFEFDKPPFVRINCSNDQGVTLPHQLGEQFVKIDTQGSSVLLEPLPAPLISIARQHGKIVSFVVPKRWDENRLSNRRYGAFKATQKKTKDVNDIILTDFAFRRSRRTTRFNVPKNAPLFVNIKHQLKDGKIIALSGSTPHFEDVILKGKYNSVLFEDAISDGCVSARLLVNDKQHDLSAWFQSLSEQCSQPLPAFSLVTAPDFFPFTDGNDIRNYYDKKDFRPDQHFTEGGTINLSGVRQRGNPRIIDPYTSEKAFRKSAREDRSFDTLTAVISARTEVHNEPTVDFSVHSQRDYNNTSFLPDTGTGIFFPGWDATYSGDLNKDGRYLATFGLGSPFPEDIKLCAAANGMWPVASPDAGRTFQGSLEAFPRVGRPKTSVALMDSEIGVHPNSPHVKEYNKTPNYGWDGEHGPYLKIKHEDQLFINFTDIGRADYIANLLDPVVGFDMSKLRQMTSIELISRMECLRKSVRVIDHKMAQYTKYWLVSAESVAEWSNGAEATAIPRKLVAGSNEWAKIGDGLKGSGYLFVFAQTMKPRYKNDGDHLKEYETPESKRREQRVRKLVVCKIAYGGFDKKTEMVLYKFSGSFAKQIPPPWKKVSMM